MKQLYATRDKYMYMNLYNFYDFCLDSFQIVQNTSCFINNQHRAVTFDIYS